MNDNALVAWVLCVSISSCTACSVSEKLKPELPVTDVQRCMNLAWRHADRMECMKPR